MLNVGTEETMDFSYKTDQNGNVLQQQKKKKNQNQLSYITTISKPEIHRNKSKKKFRY